MSLRPAFKKTLTKAFIAAPIIFGSCQELKQYEPQRFTGEVTEGLCEPSVLGSGDKYYVTLKNDSVKKRLSFYWPEATEMCTKLSKQPQIGDTWTIETTKSHRDPDRPNLHFEQGFNIIEVVPHEHH